jgi:ubiquinone biosynthesis monooxygenase Coq7
MSYSHLFAKNFEKKIQSMIRVNYAGEMGAVQIYNSQIKQTQNPQHKKQLEEMLDSEVNHFEYFKKISKELHIPQTIFLPIWKILSSIFGTTTAKHSHKTAMLYTHAVESVISKHYAKQIQELEDILQHHTHNDHFISQNKQKIQELLEKIKIFIQEEIEHKTTGETNSQMHKLPFKLMELATYTAVIISEKI